MADEMNGAQLITGERLVTWLESSMEKLLLIDSRPFVEYNMSHILEAINIHCSKLMKRRLQQDKVLITELIQHSAKQKVEIDGKQEVVVYDQNSADLATVPSDSFLSLLLRKLEKSFSNVHLLAGGFAEFSNCFPGLCEGKSILVPSCISQPCLPVSNTGPTRILPHLYLGCQRDVLNKELMQQNEIGYVLNASNTCPKPDFIPESHFLRVPVNDSFCEKIFPWLDKSVDFIEKAKASNGCVLVHCLAGISRSATIAIAYIMKRMDMSLDEAYRFVKEKRPTISPNFNFLGQLLDFEKKIKNQGGPSGLVSKFKLLHLENGSSHGAGGGALWASPQLCASSTSENVEQKSPEPGNPPAPTLPPSAEGGSLVQSRTVLNVSSDKVEDSNRLKRSFSLDIKSVSCAASNACHTASGPGYPSLEDTLEFYKHSATLEAGSKLCQFSPVQEVSEQTPEGSPDKEHTKLPEKAHHQGWQPDSQSKRQHSGRTTCPAQRSSLYPLHRSGSMEDNYRTNFVFGLSASQQHLAKSAAGLGLKGWHSDILSPQTSAASLTGSWYFTADPSHIYSASALYGRSAAYSAFSCSQLPTGCEQTYGVRRREKHGERGDSRRSWHEESSFEKQFKRRSCQMEFGESIMSENRSREELGKMGSQSSFSGSMEIIEVS
ncbi:dual specificity protein phosphatase 16 [Pantherophis guttatus]|uniref:Dual specificity protein phosphatase 16 n=1 Tax=Pantherophis guttatus TaxID=94885 RepID=A0A6P9DYW9_PANGU|nr:dual specificity protein phosphatase 16 [Pantherophis guttatus]XP_034296271.1 dual specificity protein phosphatase 16 [Pantherophis guttatus]XP_060540078.1 dual specificity protein phosphatase 16 [Pantherophis guttatus]